MHIAIFAPYALGGSLAPAFFKKLVALYPGAQYILEPERNEGFDLSVVLGGDGTFVRACRTLPEVPVIGFHAGTRGFLTPHNLEFTERVLEDYQRGDYRISPRQTLKVHRPYDSDRIAVNEVVFQRRLQDPGLPFAVEFESDEGNELISDLRADGLIVATATGSTAYSMNAGGSILHPTLKANILTPICPLSPGFRSLVYPSERTLKVRALEDRNGPRWVNVTIDGQDLALMKGETTTISQGPELQVVRVSGCEHFVQSVQNKLNWAR